MAVAGFSTTLSALILPAVARLRETRPLLRTSLAEVDPPESFSMLHRGETDVVISADTARNPGPAGDESRFDGQFHRVPLCETLRHRPPRGPPAPREPRLLLADLAEETWIFATTGMCHDIGVAACTAAGFTPQASHAIGDWDATLAAVRLGLGVALVPRMAKPARGPR